MADDETRTRRFTRAEYERLVDLSVFQPGEAIELIGGQLMVAERQGASHYTAIRKTAKALEAAFGPGWEVRTEGPIGLDEDSEPEPDVAVVLYARAGLPDYWVLNLVDRVLEMYRRSVPDSAAPFGWRYAQGEVLDASARVSALAAPGSSILVSRLLP